METTTGHISPLKCALKYKPPLFILVYKDGATGKIRRRSMPLREFKADTNISTYIKELQTSRNKLYINAIPEAQLVSLLQRLKQEQITSSRLEQAPISPLSPSSLQGIPPLTIPSGKQKSAELGDLGFTLALNALLNDEKSRQTDQVVDQAEDDMCLSSIEEMKDEEGDNDLNGEKFTTDHLLANWCKEDSEEDLNKVSEEQLAQRKAEMEKLYEANRIKPGDDEYEYNREADFGGPKIESGWDSDISSNMEF